MGFIQGFRIKNYRLLKDVTLGSISADANSETALSLEKEQPLTPITVVIGRNGYGKSTLCDALGFIVDCLKSDVEQACLLRGGFDQIATMEPDDADSVKCADSATSNRIIEFHIRCDALFYTLCIAADEYNVPYVYAETLSRIDLHLSGKTSTGQASSNKTSAIFAVKQGMGNVFYPPRETNETIHLADKRRLVLSTLGNLADYPDIVAFREWLDRWFLCYFEAEAVRITPQSGPQKHLSRTGSNLANVIQYWEQEHPGRLGDMLNRVLGNVSGIKHIETCTTEDGRLLIRFFESCGIEPCRREKPFYVSQMSEGTLKLIAYLMLLGDPHPPSLVCFEEPESGLYHRLLGAFVDEIRRHGDEPDGAQFFITTHQPYLVDSLNPKEVWILDKGADGFAAVRRASDDPVVHHMVAEGMPLGALWFSEYLDN